jgi:hypothetical protein
MRKVLPCLLVLFASLGYGQVTSVFGRTGAVVANTGDYTAAKVTNAVDTTQTYSNPSWIVTLDWSKIINAPLNTNGVNNLAVGNFALFSNTSGSGNTAVGHVALYKNNGSNNTAVGDAALASNQSADSSTAVGANALAFLTVGGYSTAVGEASQENSSAGSHNTSVGVASMFGGVSCLQNPPSGYSGFNNTAIGDYSFCSVTTGAYNTLLGMNSGYLMTTGNHNVAIGYQAGYTNAPANANTTGSNNTWIGDNAGPGTPTQLTNSTAIGANAVVTQSNSLILGGTGVNAVSVGIGTTTPFNVFTIGQNAGHALADGWDVYSSRRYKTNIETLQGSLAKVEQLRGVSYDLKGSGKHEVGVIAEEVGDVLPEVVSWSKDGEQAEGVDYGRLTALLIGAMKEQQELIDRQREQIRAQQEQINRLASQMTGVKVSLESNRRATVAVRVVKDQLPAIHQ